jgi:hypothetical protein
MVRGIRAFPWAIVVMTALVAVRSQAAPDGGFTATEIRIGVEADIGSLSLDGENQGFKVAFE